jgi:2-amino-4-hydroxy-6-hydroxymethyldihydropteridine diphosphokinase
MATATYLNGIGANRRGRHGAPADEVRAALRAIGGIEALSPIVGSAALGPSRRAYANAAALIASDETPPVLLDRLKTIERAFGRRRGQRWGARVIDLDILFWSGGAWTSPGLIVPHSELRRRRFVLDPLLVIAPDWRDPVSGLAVRHLAHRLTARQPLPRARDSW